MNKQLLNRRNFNGLCLALGSSLSSVGAMTVALSRASARAAPLTVKFHDGTIVAALGQGSANLAQGRYPEAAEEEALRTGLSLGMNLIDTAEAYGNGRSEKSIGGVIAGQRDRVFLVSKVWPDHAAGNGIARACEASLGRLGIDYIDLYLLHWPSRDTNLSSIVAAFESLRAAGKIRAWGVSNFYVSDMERLGACPTSTSATWNASSMFHTATAARPIRSFTTSAAAALSTICCHGASSAARR